VAAAPLAAVAPAGGGTRTGRVALARELPIDPARPYVLVVADPGNAISETDNGNNAAHFRKLTLGVLTHGLSLFGNRPTWIDQVGDALEALGYADTVRFEWVARSRLPAPDLAILTGLELAQAVRQRAAELATQPGDVVDVHFIGHSRGTAVVTVALLALQIAPGPPELALGYFKQTLLDPHVARNHGTRAAGLAELARRNGVSNVGLFSYNPNSALVRTAAAGVIAFQATAQDPVPFIPAVADEAEVFFQRLPLNRTVTSDRLLGVNLWAELPGAIANPAGRPVVFINLAPFGVGHTNVPEFYLFLITL
jgi:hypothetical protein